MAVINVPQQTRQTGSQRIESSELVSSRESGREQRVPRTRNEQSKENSGEIRAASSGERENKLTIPDLPIEDRERFVLALYVSTERAASCALVLRREMYVHTDTELAFLFSP